MNEEPKTLAEAKRRDLVQLIDQLALIVGQLKSMFDVEIAEDRLRRGDIDGMRAAICLPPLQHESPEAAELRMTAKGA